MKRGTVHYLPVRPNDTGYNKTYYYQNYDSYMEFETSNGLYKYEPIRDYVQRFDEVDVSGEFLHDSYKQMNEVMHHYDN